MASLRLVALALCLCLSLHASAAPVWVAEVVEHQDATCPAGVILYGCRNAPINGDVIPNETPVNNVFDLPEAPGTPAECVPNKFVLSRNNCMIKPVDGGADEESCPGTTPGALPHYLSPFEWVRQLTDEQSFTLVQNEKFPITWSLGVWPYGAADEGTPAVTSQIGRGGFIGFGLLKLNDGALSGMNDRLIMTSGDAAQGLHRYSLCELISGNSGGYTDANLAQGNDIPPFSGECAAGYTYAASATVSQCSYIQFFARAKGVIGPNEVLSFKFGFLSDEYREYSQYAGQQYNDVPLISVREVPDEAAPNAAYAPLYDNTTKTVPTNRAVITYPNGTEVQVSVLNVNSNTNTAYFNGQNLGDYGLEYYGYTDIIDGPPDQIIPSKLYQFTMGVCDCGDGFSQGASSLVLGRKSLRVCNRVVRPENITCSFDQSNYNVVSGAGTQTLELSVVDGGCLIPPEPTFVTDCTPTPQEMIEVSRVKVGTTTTYVYEPSVTDISMIELGITDRSQFQCTYVIEDASGEQMQAGLSVEGIPVPGPGETRPAFDYVVALNAEGIATIDWGWSGSACCLEAFDINFDERGTANVAGAYPVVPQESKETLPDIDQRSFTRDLSVKYRYAGNYGVAPLPNDPNRDDFGSTRPWTRANAVYLTQYELTNCAGEVAYLVAKVCVLEYDPYFGNNDPNNSTQRQAMLDVCENNNVVSTTAPPTPPPTPTPTPTPSPSPTLPPGPPPEPRTPGYWKNWNNCTGNSPQPESVTHNGNVLIDERLPMSLGSYQYPASTDGCLQMVATLFMRETVSPYKKASNDNFSKLATHLAAAKLNQANGACVPKEVEDAINAADQLLTQINWSGQAGASKDRYLKSMASLLHDILDNYNNDRITCN